MHCKISFLFFTLLLFLSGTDILGQELQQSNHIFLSLWRQAEKLQLARHPYWLKLLHFYSPGESVGQWSFESDIVGIGPSGSSGFFLSPNGKTDPEAELKATLKALLSPSGENPDQDTRCKFIARFHWLRSELSFPELLAPGVPAELPCPLFERWANLDEAEEMSLVFVSAFLENPASTFGHLLIKFNSRNRYFGHSLLSPTLNFGAMVNPDDNPLVYALRGLFGGYNGSFTDERFYNFNHVYGENELRDLWEYPLRFTPEERRRVTYHAWELLQNVQFTYYFFLDNCAYRMAELLETAWTDETRLNTSGAFWAIPADVVFKIQDKRDKVEGRSLLGKPRLIPSRQRKLKQRVRQLNRHEKEELRKLVIDEKYLDTEKFSHLPENSQAKILDAFLDYQQYVKDSESTPEQQKKRVRLLRKRSRLPILQSEPDSEPDNKVSAKTPESPTEGTPPMRFRFGAVFNQSAAGFPVSGPAFELGIWANYHDLLGDQSGHLPNAEVVTLDLRLQFQESEPYKTLQIKQFQLFNIQKLALNPTGIPGDFEWSWRARGGWERKNLRCVRFAFPCRQFRIAGGFGHSASFSGDDVEYAFIDFFGETPSASWSAITWGYAPHFGLTWSPLESWKMRAEGGWFRSFSGPQKEYFRSRFDQRWTLAKNWDIRLELEQWEGIEGTLALHFFW